MRTEPLSLIIVDDQLIFREALEFILSPEKELTVIQSFENGSELIHYLSDKHSQIPDVIVLDLAMPVMNGYETSEWLNKNKPEIPVLILSTYDGTEIAREMMENGVLGICSKNCPFNELKKAIFTIAKGEIYIDSRTQQQLLKENKLFRKSDPKKIEPFNPQERKLLKMLADGFTDKQIAEECRVSLRTAEKYSSDWQHRFNARNRTHLASILVEKGIVVR